MSAFWSSLSHADKINFVIAIGTALTALFAAWSAWLAKRSIRGALEEFRAQTFLGILTYEREVEFSRHMDVIRSMKSTAYGQLTDEDKKSILVVVNFLNHLAHLLRNHYAVPTQLWLLYAPSIAACRAKLLGEGQWLTGLRDETGEPRYYLHFERLCQKDTEARIWAGKEIVWTADPYTPQFPAS